MKRSRSDSLENEVKLEQKQVKTESILTLLPIELILEVLLNLGPSDLLSIGLTSKFFQKLSQVNSLWNVLFEKFFEERGDFIHLIPLTKNLDPISKFKVFYLEYLKTISFTFPPHDDNIFQPIELNSTAECLDYFSRLISEGKEIFLNRNFEDAYSYFTTSQKVIVTSQEKFKKFGKIENKWELDSGLDLLELNIFKGMCLRNMRYYTLAKSTYIASISMARELSTRFRSSHLRVIGYVISAYQNLGVVLCLQQNYSLALSIYDQGYLLWVEFIQEANPTENQIQEFLSFLCNRIYTLRKLNNWEEIAGSLYEYSVHASAYEQDIEEIEEFIEAQMMRWSKEELGKLNEHLEKLQVKENEHFQVFKDFLKKKLSL